jgi:hypothetical protein
VDLADILTLGRASAGKQRIINIWLNRVIAIAHRASTGGAAFEALVKRPAAAPGGSEDTVMRHAWRVVALVLALVGMPSGPLDAQDKPIELKFSSWVATVHGHHTGVMVPWAKMVEEKSGGRLKITIYPGSTLGKAVDHYDMVKDGIADMGFTTPATRPAASRSSR